MCSTGAKGWQLGIGSIKITASQEYNIRNGERGLVIRILNVGKLTYNRI